MSIRVLTSIKVQVCVCVCVCVCACVHVSQSEADAPQCELMSRLSETGFPFLSYLSNPHFGKLPTSDSVLHIRPTCHILFIAPETSFFSAKLQSLWFGSKGLAVTGNSAFAKDQKRRWNGPLSAPGCSHTCMHAHPQPLKSSRGHPRKSIITLLFRYKRKTIFL